jgi:Tripartite tricarboxylate transporter family receptor
VLAQLSTAKPLIDGGQLRPLGIASKARRAVLPDLPTIAEAGEMPGFEAESWYALMAPAQTPHAPIRRAGRDGSEARHRSGCRWKKCPSSRRYSLSRNSAFGTGGRNGLVSVSLITQARSTDDEYARTSQTAITTTTAIPTATIILLAYRMMLLRMVSPPSIG